MRRRLISTTLTMTCLLLIAFVAQAQTRVYRGTFQSVRRLIVRLDNRATIFTNSVQDWASRNPLDSSSRIAGEDIDLFVRDFDESVRQLRDRFDARHATSADVQDVLNRAVRIDVFLNRHSTDMRTRNQWSLVRSDLNQLASAFYLTWPQTSGTYPPYNNYPDNTYPPYGNQPGRFGNRLTGTYRVDFSRSDNARDAAERATRDLAPSERRRITDAVGQRLEAPEQLALDVRGRNVTIASTRASQISFVADGRDRIETNAAGRTVRSRATLSGDRLIVSTTGDRGNDFSVTFDLLDNGRHLNVVRRVYLQGLSQPVVVQSVYEKTSDVARFDIYNPSNVPGSSTAGFVVPDGTRVIGVLENNLSTRTARAGDRFTMRVTSPVEYEGATIEGHVSRVERSGRLSGRSYMTLDFDNIRLRDGRSYQFAGLVETVRESDGNVVRVDTEGTVRDESQTSRTATRAAIGTAVGAIIGAIAGGGKGAAIGAIIGAGGGAGSVYVEGRNDLELRSGSEITVRAGAPNSLPR